MWALEQGAQQALLRTHSCAPGAHVASLCHALGCGGDLTVLSRWSRKAGAAWMTQAGHYCSSSIGGEGCGCKGGGGRRLVQHECSAQLCVLAAGSNTGCKNARLR
jgi:hypothetical protein